MKSYYDPKEVAVLSPLVMVQLREGKKCRLSIRNNKLIEKTLVIMPVHQGGNHWKLTIVEGISQAVEEAEQGRDSVIQVFEHDHGGTRGFLPYRNFNL